jgi:hypothetical protein
MISNLTFETYNLKNIFILNIMYNCDRFADFSVQK